MKNPIVQRFQPGHPLYSDAWIENKLPEHGVVGKFQANFGQIIDETGKRLHYTMERRDTLIPLGKYPFVYYQSPVNGRVVLLQNVPGFQYIEHHPANWAYQLKGCTAHGMSVDVKTPALITSRDAIKAFMNYLNNETGFITYENLKQ